MSPKMQAAFEVPLIFGLCAVACCILPLYLLLQGWFALTKPRVWRKWSPTKGGYYDHP